MSFGKIKPFDFNWYDSCRTHQSDLSSCVQSYTNRIDTKLPAVNHKELHLFSSFILNRWFSFIFSFYVHRCSIYDELHWSPFVSVLMMDIYSKSLNMKSLRSHEKAGIQGIEFMPLSIGE
jgi:hypothetical protein